MRKAWLISVRCLLLAPFVSLAAIASDPATPVPADCPVTQPNGDMPPGAGNPDFIGGYGNDALWTNLWMWGTGPVHVDPDSARPGQTHGPGKWAWYRYIPGELTIDGRRLDGPAPPLLADIPEGYGTIGFQVSGLSFPVPGCWEVTGRVGGQSLVFVLLVVSGGPVATPESSP